MANITQAVAVLQDGGLIAYPTETFYGLGALVSRPEALERLWALKERDRGGPLSVLIARLDDLEGLATRPAYRLPALARLAERFWPGPLTLVIDARAEVHRCLVGPDGGVGVRISSHPLAARLVSRLQTPITATSANYRGRPPARSADQIRASGLAAHLDFVLDGGHTAGVLPSTVVRVDSHRLVVLRLGAVSSERLATALDGLDVTVESAASRLPED